MKEIKNNACLENRNDDIALILRHKVGIQCEHLAWYLFSFLGEAMKVIALPCTPQ